MIDRTNDDWLQILTQTGPAREEAIADLRELLKRGLGKALRDHSGVDDAFLEDITQDSVLKVLDALSTFRGDSKFTTWAIAVSVRVAFSELRRARWRDVSLDGLAHAGKAPEPAARSASSSEMERNEIIAVMKRVMDDDLTERQRFVLAGELNGMPQAELCARLGLNRNALYKLSHDARKKLRHGLQVAGVTEEVVREVFAIAT